MKLFTRFLPLTLVLIALVGCKKETFTGPSSEFLEVEEKNSSLVFHYSMTSNPASGSTGYDYFTMLLNQYDSTEVLATMTFGGLGGANNDAVFLEHVDTFNFVTIPYFQGNYDSVSMVNVGDKISSHSSKVVIANAAYQLQFEPNQIIINTTTQFFQDVDQEDYYLSAYLIVDSIVAFQEGHPDLGSTVHRKSVVDVGRLQGHQIQYLGYPITAGGIDNGYKFNLQFVADRLPSWVDEDRISVALVITTRDSAGRPVFVNANTNH